MTNKICPICGFEFKGHATWDAHMATHNDKYSEIVGVCSKCGKPLSFFGTNMTNAMKKGNAVDWKCEKCR